MTTPPRSSAKPISTTTNDSASEGSIVHYEDDGSPILGVAIGTRKDKLLVQNIRGREVELARNRLHIAPGSIPASMASTTKSRLEFLENLSRSIDAQLDGCALETVWEVVVSEARAYSVSELTHLYFGKDDLVSHLAMRTALIREKTHFKRERDLFEPRSESVVEDLKRAEAHKREKLRVQQAMIEAFEQKRKNPGMDLPDFMSDSIALLEELAANAPHVDPARQKESKDLLALCLEKFAVPSVGNPEEKAFALLELVGHFTRDTNLSLIRHRVPVEFSRDTLAEAHQLIAAIGIGEDSSLARRDLTGIFTFTVDDQSTKDMDDALSIRQTQDGYELGIHITDVASVVPATSSLDLEARRRASSIYCADRTINMFPDELSEAGASLIAGQARKCISCLVQVDSRFDIQSWELFPSLISVAKRYTYDDVDRLLDEHDLNLSTLYEAAAAHEAWRIERGASRIQKREVVPLVQDDGSIALLEIDEASPARMIVAEMMVLMNRLMAQYAVDNAIPVLFRGQERAEPIAEDEKRGDEPDGPARDFATRTRLKKSVTTMVPLPHASLGLTSYLQGTSPIRRYMDLCHQRQLLGFWTTGKPWLDSERFEELAREVEQALEAAVLVGRETRRYWLTRYLEQRGKSKTITATVVRTDTKLPLVELDEVYLTVFARSQRKIKVGDSVEVKLTHLDARYDYVRGEIV